MACFLEITAEKNYFMKKTILFLVSSVISIFAAAQVSLQAGVNIANISVSDNGTVDKANALTSFHVGFIGDWGLSRVLDIQTGLFLSGKGAKEEVYLGSSTDDNYYKSKINPFYIEVPVNLILKFPLPDKSHLFVGTGPYGAMGIFGKAKGESKILGVTSTFEKNLSFNNDDPSTSQQEDAGTSKLRRFDFGWNFTGGININNKLTLKINYGLGLAKINSTGNNNADDKNKHRVLSFAVAIPLN